MGLAPAAGLSRAARAARQPDESREGGPGAPPVLRRAAVRQRDPVLRVLPPAEARLHGRPRACPRVHGRVAPPERDEPRERGLRRFPDVGRHRPPDPRRPDAGPASRRAPRRDGPQGGTRRGARRLGPIPLYSVLFSEAFPGEKAPVNLANVRKAIAAFERTIVSADSPYDRLVWKDERDGALRGGAARHGALLLGTARLLDVSRGIHVLGARRSGRAAPAAEPTTRRQRRRRPLPRSHPSKRRRDRALHARRAIRHARGGRGPLRERWGADAGPQPPRAGLLRHRARKCAISWSS